jgi:hypothetical protein
MPSASGFNEFNPALADDGLEDDGEMAKAISTSYGKRPIKVSGWNFCLVVVVAQLRVSCCHHFVVWALLRNHL